MWRIATSGDDDSLDPAAAVRACYLAHCDERTRAGIPAPTPEQLVNALDDLIRDARELPSTE